MQYFPISWWTQLPNTPLVQHLLTIQAGGYKYSCPSGGLPWPYLPIIDICPFRMPWLKFVYVISAMGPIVRQKGYQIECTIILNIYMTQTGNLMLGTLLHAIFIVTSCGIHYPWKYSNLTKSPMHLPHIPNAAFISQREGEHFCSEWCMVLVRCGTCETGLLSLHTETHNIRRGTFETLKYPWRPRDQCTALNCKYIGVGAECPPPKKKKKKKKIC